MGFGCEDAHGEVAGTTGWSQSVGGDRRETSPPNFMAPLGVVRMRGSSKDLSCGLGALGCNTQSKSNFEFDEKLERASGRLNKLSSESPLSLSSEGLLFDDVSNHSRCGDVRLDVLLSFVCLRAVGVLIQSRSNGVVKLEVPESAPSKTAGGLASALLTSVGPPKGACNMASNCLCGCGRCGGIAHAKSETSFAACLARTSL